MRALVHEAGDQNTVTRASASEGALEVARYRRSLQLISSTVPSAPSSIAPVRLGPENTHAPAMKGSSAPSTGRERKCVAKGKSVSVRVDIGGRRIITKN